MPPLATTAVCAVARPSVATKCGQLLETLAYEAWEECTCGRFGDFHTTNIQQTYNNHTTIHTTNPYNNSFYCMI